jgi:hypothetical protein
MRRRAKPLGDRRCSDPRGVWMIRRQHRGSTMRRILAVGVGAMTVAIPLAPALAQTAPEHSQVSLTGHAATINTWKQWTKQQIAAQGPGETWADTFGQVITVPRGRSRLDKFEFYMDLWSKSGQLVMRGEVYAWDGQKATGQALWESAPRTVAPTLADGWQGVSFKAGGIGPDLGSGPSARGFVTSHIPRISAATSAGWPCTGTARTGRNSVELTSLSPQAGRSGRREPRRATGRTR